MLNFTNDMFVEYRKFYNNVAFEIQSINIGIKERLDKNK